MPCEQYFIGDLARASENFQEITETVDTVYWDQTLHKMLILKKVEAGESAANMRRTNPKNPSGLWPSLPLLPRPLKKISACPWRLLLLPMVYLKNHVQHLSQGPGPRKYISKMGAHVGRMLVSGELISKCFKTTKVRCTTLLKTR
jgi:hypothetical protein